MVTNANGSNERITGTSVNALGKYWHTDHFVCEECKEPLGKSNDAKFTEKDGKVFCIKDYQKLFLSACHKCNKLIENTVTLALDKKWHADCFVCIKCNSKFKNGKFFIENGEPTCGCDHVKKTCYRCKKDIQGTFVRAFDENYYCKECFTCNDCGNQITGTYFIDNGKWFCENEKAKHSK